LPTFAEVGAAALRGPAFCTIIAKNYLPKARALARSLRRHHPELPLYVLVVDEMEGYIDPGREAFAVVPLASLDPPDPRDLAFRYEILELCTAVKPLFLQWLFARGHSKVVFLDPDVWVYRPLDALLAHLDDADVVLTPHLTAPIDDGKYPDERLILLVGAYNLGFVALARRPPAEALVRWWWDRCRNLCLLEVENGLFLDQKWMNLVPGMLDRVLVLRHPGYNIAHWNLHDRRLAGSPAAPTVNGQPLYFMHYSSVDALDPSRLTCPQTRYDRLDEEPLVTMLREYSSELVAAGHQVCAAWPYTYAAFDDGYEIDREMRRLFRDLPPGRFADPFRADTFRQWALAPAAGAPLVAARPPGFAAPLSPRPPDARAGYGSIANEPAPRADGVTVVGYVHAESGMGELVRSTVSALGAVSYPVSVHELRDLAHRHADLSVRATAGGAEHAIRLVVLTAPDALRERRGLLPAPAGPTIGYWPWELESFPDDVGDVFAGFDEIWALSRFSAESIARAAPVPVHAVWPAVPDVASPAAPAADDALDPDEFNFLFVYDLLSETDRKNPVDLVRAFRAAFRRDDRVRLTIKTTNGVLRGDEMAGVVAAAGGLAVTVRDRYMGRRELLALMRSCDCYASLHRAEGFGFTLVEAMALGKPVIATFYSANTEYMTPWNSLPVPFRMGEVRVRRGAYRPGDAWAEPDVEAAAELMRTVYRDRDRARAIGERGRRDVLEQLSPSACGSRMARRLRSARPIPAPEAVGRVEAGA